MTEPTYEMFKSRAMVGGLTAFIMNLEEGEPQCLPEKYRNSKVTTISSHITRVAKDGGFKVALRTIDGEIWACRLKPEDVKS